MSTVIEFHNVWKSFKLGQNVDSLRDLIPHLLGKFRPSLNKQKKRETFWALKDVNFEIKRGETVGLIGHNGSGKTTTLKLLSGILRQTKGDISKKGRIGALIEVGAGFHGDLTGRENIYLNGSIMGMKKWEIDKKFDEIVAFAEVEDFIDTPVKRYSSGMYVRLGFSVAAHLEPEILLIDEVLAVGDICFQAKCIEKIKELREKNTTIFFVSHNMESVLDLCPRSVLLHKGQIFADERTENVVKRYRDSVQKRSTAETADRKGTSPINIKTVSFFNEDRSERLSFKTGDKIRIRIILEASQKISRPVLGIAFYDEKGTCVYGHNSKVDKYDLGNVCGVYEVEVEYKYMDLQPGNYLVTIGIFDTLGVKAYEYKDRAYGFTINGQKSEIGLIYIPHVWNYRQRDVKE